MAFRKIFKKTKKKIIGGVSDVLSAPSRSRSRARGRKADQLREDSRFLREMRKSAKKRNVPFQYSSSAKKLQDPKSPVRRNMRVQSFKNKTLRKVFKSNK